MKNPLLRGLQVIGLAPLGHLYEVRAKASETDLTVRELRGKIEHLSREVASHRDDAARARTQAESAERRHQEALAQAEATIREARDAATQSKAKADEIVAQFRALRGKLVDAERTEGQLRELLMSNETKLDLVEAAINLLDVRTRREA